MYVGLVAKTPLMYQQQAISQQPTIPQQLFSSPVTFTQDEPIDDAFTKLSAYVTTLIQNTNFPSLQRACIEKAKSPRMLHKSNEIIPAIKEAQSFQVLCSMLADTTYWNILDTRMMEAMATASMIPAAQVAIENFKKTFYNMTLKEAAPYFPVIPVKPGYTTMHEDLDRDPSQMTIGELHKHRFHLETKVIQTGPDTCTICQIKIGSVTIIWQIHAEHAYQAYSRLKGLDFQLSSLAIRFMSVPEMEVWDGLLFLWPGQDMGEVGPIESSSCIKQEPYPLPPGFEWCTLNPSNFDEIIELHDELIITHTIDVTNHVSKNWLEWVISYPQHDKNGYLLGIRLSSSKRLVWFISSVPCNIRVGRKVLSTAYLYSTCSRDAGKYQYQLYNAGFKETVRILGSKGIFQAFIVTSGRIMPNPIIKFDQYAWFSYKHSLPYSSPRTVGLRKMKASDIPKAFNLTNQYTSQFEIGQIFQSEEEFSHWFLSPLLDNITTYVVEEPNSGNITDLFSFGTRVLSAGSGPDFKSERIAAVIALVITNSSPKQLITDLLVCCVKQHKAIIVILPNRFGLKEHLFENFLKASFVEQFYNPTYYLLYNYKYPKVNNDNYCIFSTL